MDQMADEMTLGVDVKDKGRVNTAEQSSTWVRGERIQSEAEVSNWRLDAPPETKPGETGRDTDAQRPRQCDSSSSLLSLKLYLKRSSSAESSSTDSLSSPQQSSTGDRRLLEWGGDDEILRRIWTNVQVQEFFLQAWHSYALFDCAGMVLNCLFCRFYDMILMLPDSCGRVANHCCPNYKQVITTVESTPSSTDDSCMGLDCGLFSSCQDTSECLELAMEISELCYR